MSYSTDEMTTRAASVFSTLAESKFPSKSFTNSISSKVSTESLNKKLKTIQTSRINQGVHFSTSKKLYQNTSITNNETTSILKSKSEKLIESTDAYLTTSKKSTERNVNSEGDQFTKLMLQNDISLNSNIKESASSLKMAKERFTPSQVVSSLTTSPNIVASLSFRDNTGLTLENNYDLSTKTALFETQSFTVPVKPIETSATQTKPSKSPMSPDKIRFLDSTMQSTITMKEDSTFRLQDPTSLLSTIPVLTVTNRNLASTLKLKAPLIHTEETQKHASILPSYKVSTATEAKLNSKTLNKNPTKTLNLKEQLKRSSALQKLNTASIVIHGNQMKKTSSHSLSSSTIVPQSTKHPVFNLKPTGFYSIHSQTYTNDFHLGNTTEPNQTMGAGALVIVVLLPFLALFLIAVVTALRRKMKKNSRRGRRFKNQDVENKIDRDQSQMVPLTKSEVIE